MAIEADVGFLVGSDAPEVLEPREIRRSQNGGPYASRTVFGWIVNGRLGRTQRSATRTANFIRTNVELSEQFRSYCNMEFNDSIYDRKHSLLQNHKNGRYEIALTWKTNPPCLDNNKPVAQHRLRLLQKRLSKDQELSKTYKECMEDLLRKGYAKEAPVSETP